MPVIEEILREAREAGASDVHITAGIPPRMRVGGKLVTMNCSRLQQADTLDILLGIMPTAQQERFEGKGEYQFSFSAGDGGRYRVSAFKQKGSVAMAIRLVNTKVSEPEELGIPASVVELYRKRRGLILVTGAAGSGKSTTLAAILNKINSSRAAHIITLEEPIEYLHDHKMSIVNQREIGIDCGTYEEAVNAAVKEDPDVILLGEMRDPDTVARAIEAAETGCLVLSSLDTMGTAAAIDRVVNIFPPYYQQQFRLRLAKVLEAVVFQQLIPGKEGQGRVAAFEVVYMYPAVRNLIREGKLNQIFSVMQTGKGPGMVTMDEAILRLCAQRKIDVENALWYAQDPAAMKQRLTAGTGKNQVNPQ